MRDGRAPGTRPQWGQERTSDPSSPPCHPCDASPHQGQLVAAFWFLAVCSQGLEDSQVRAGGARCHQLGVLMSSSCHQERDILIKGGYPDTESGFGLLNERRICGLISHGPSASAPQPEGGGRVGTHLSGHGSLGPLSPAGTTPHPQSSGSIEGRGHRGQGTSRAGRGQTQVVPPAQGAVPSVTPSLFSCCTCEPQECAALPEAVSHVLYPSHQLIHLAQGGSVDAPARSWGQWGAQRDVHVGQSQVEEEGASAGTAQGTEGQCSASRGRQWQEVTEVVALLKLRTRTSGPSSPVSAAAPWGKTPHVHHPAASPPGTHSPYREELWLS